VIWLKASVETIERRLQGDESTIERRPDLTSGGGRAEIENLLAIRNPVYSACASIAIETDFVDESGEIQVKGVDELLDSILVELEPLIDQEVRS
jgi:shikimate kinase